MTRKGDGSLQFSVQCLSLLHIESHLLSVSERILNSLCVPLLFISSLYLNGLSTILNGSERLLH